MSTNSYIGKQNDDGTVRAIYCHWDGYPSHVGSVLKLNYDSMPAIDALLDLGDLSSIDSRLDICVAYNRDRGEVGVDAKSYASLETFVAGGSHVGANYWYLYREGVWKVWSHGETSWTSMQ